MRRRDGLGGDSIGSVSIGPLSWFYGIEVFRGRFGFYGVGRGRRARNRKIDIDGFRWFWMIIYFYGILSAGNKKGLTGFITSIKKLFGLFENHMKY